MKISLAVVICVFCIFFSMVCIPSSYGFQNVGDSFGSSWLAKYGTEPTSKIEIQNNLWRWGSAPKGFSLINGTLYPPGYAPQWYYPDTFRNNDTPIVINNTGSGNQQPNYQGMDPWLTAQLTGRPVTVVREPRSTLF
jgi:hypothetical protein